MRRARWAVVAIVAVAALARWFVPRAPRPPAGPVTTTTFPAPAPSPSTTVPAGAAVAPPRVTETPAAAAPPAATLPPVAPPAPRSRPPREPRLRELLDRYVAETGRAATLDESDRRALILALGRVRHAAQVRDRLPAGNPVAEQRYLRALAEADRTFRDRLGIGLSELDPALAAPQEPSGARR